MPFECDGPGIESMGIGPCDLNLRIVAPGVLDGSCVGESSDDIGESRPSGTRASRRSCLPARGNRSGPLGRAVVSPVLIGRPAAQSSISSARRLSRVSGFFAESTSGSRCDGSREPGPATTSTPSGSARNLVSASGSNDRTSFS